MGGQNQDFVRQLPDSARHFGRSAGFLRRLHLDPILILVLGVLTFFGLMVLYSASGQDEGMLRRQMAFFCVGYASMFSIAQVDMQTLRRWSPWFYALGIILLILVFLIGVGAKGAQRWISLGFFRFQPSEVLKIAVPVAVAAYFSTRVLPPRPKHIFWCMVIIGLPAVLILKQPDLGTAILISASGLICLFLAGIRWRFIFGSVMVLLVSLWPMWQFVMKDYQKRRVLTL